MSLPSSCFYYDQDFHEIDHTFCNIGWYISPSIIAYCLMKNIIENKELFDKSSYVKLYDYMFKSSDIKKCKDYFEYKRKLIKSMEISLPQERKNELYKMNIFITSLCEFPNEI